MKVFLFILGLILEIFGIVNMLLALEKKNLKLLAFAIFEILLAYFLIGI